MIDSFRGQYAFLSNLYNCRIEYNGLFYQNVEAAYQAQKCPERAAEFTGLSGVEAKRLGRRVQLSPGFDDSRVDLMTELIHIKFSTNEQLKHMLLNTRAEELVEGNDWNDTFWGVCRGVGKNHLGKILMSVRTVLSVIESN